MEKNKTSQFGLWLIFLFILISLKPLMGQGYNMVVHNKDGTTKIFAIADIKELTFSGITGVNEFEKIKNASHFAELLKTYPNPVSTTTTIEYQLEKPGQVKIRIYNQQGVLVKELLNKKLPEGKHKLLWDTGGKAGKKVDAGVYLCTIHHQNHIHSKRIIVIN